MRLTRRALIGRGVGLLVGGAAVTLRADDRPPQRRYGAIDVQRHAHLMRRGVFLHVWYRGVDVTARCFFADDTDEGFADLFVHNAAGRPFLDPATRKAAQERVVGVTVTERPCPSR